MCGIAGLFGPSLPERKRLVAGMLAALAHRGPDGSGLAEAEDFCLGHRRLAVYDPSDAAAQPMRHPDTGDILAFNGAIYNFRDLRDRLGLSPRSSGDTEVLLRALALRGLDCLDDLNGPWAFAWWQESNRRLVLCRDRLGVKPLFWTRWGPYLAFASETKALLTLPRLERRLDVAAAADFLTERMQGQGEGTFFADIRRVPAASWMVLRPGGAAPEFRRYWTGPARGIEEPPDLEQRLDAAVTLRLQADVPVAMTLSGGLDSGSIAARAAGPGGTPVTAYSLRYGDDDREFALARATAGRLPGVELRDVVLRGHNLPRAFEAVTRTLGEPFADGSMIAHYALMRRIREDGFKVVLSGLGGDEALAGYVPAQALALAAQFLRRGAVAPALGSLADPADLRRALPHALPAGLKNRLRRLRHRRQWGDLLAPAWLAKASLRFTPEGADGLFRHYLDEGLTRWYLPGFLHYDDHNAMAWGIEARAPFLDPAVLDWGFSAAPERLVRRGLGKVALRDANRDRLPAAVVNRRDKQGLPAPAAAWLADSRDFAQDALAQGARRLPGLRWEAVRSILRAAPRPLSGAALEIVWRSLSLALWAEIHGVSE